jgi:hypothetical protein
MTPKNIAIYTEPLPPAFHWNAAEPWRGTEEFYVETARCLAELGHKVTVYYDGPYFRANGDADSALPLFLPRSEYRGGHDVVLSCNTQPPALLPGARHVYWSNLHGDRFERHLWADEQIVISKFQRQNHEEPEYMNDGQEAKFRTHVVGHGVDAEKYAPGEKQPIALYSSSMDRGGYWLKANWDSFNTGLRLVCTEGRMTDEEVTALYRAAKVWLHPCMGVELFCISALKAQAAGCLCVYSPTMALPETVRPGHIALAPHRWRKDLAARLALTPTPAVPTLPTWMEMTQEIEKLLVKA